MFSLKRYLISWSVLVFFIVVRGFCMTTLNENSRSRTTKQSFECSSFNYYFKCNTRCDRGTVNVVHIPWAYYNTIFLNRLGYITVVLEGS